MHTEHTEHSAGEKPVHRLLEEQSEELKSYIDQKHREMEELLAECPNSCGKNSDRPPRRPKEKTLKEIFLQRFLYPCHSKYFFMPRLTSKRFYDEYCRNQYDSNKLVSPH